MNLNDSLKKWDSLPRNKYFEKNQELSEKLWNEENIPTVFDIAEFISNKENEKMNRIFDFFGNKEEFVKMIGKTDFHYDEEESINFIKKVMSANNTEISDAGFFYKLLMSSADDFHIVERDCESEGSALDVKSLDENAFNYHINSMFVQEIGDFTSVSFNNFMNNVGNLEKIHIRHPLSCKHAKNHGICKKCAGVLPDANINIGLFTTLMVTEHATQNALSSMNKGVKENINDLLTLRYDGNENWEEIQKWIETMTERLNTGKVQARFYEIALLSRVRYSDGKPFVSSMKSSIIHSDNPFGAYIFTPTVKNFEKMVRMKEFDDQSLKLKIAMNDYSEITNY